ncbi:MAG: methionine adenosyltransferase [Lachnospirales bacterium]
MRRIFTSESVTEGHPDKICDQISDSILDAILEQDSKARVACEILATTGLVVVAGEITTDCYVDIQKIVRKTITDIGYTSIDKGFDGDTCGVIVALDGQSPDIAQGVDKALETRNQDEDENNGAGDQGMMFGYACDETETLMPMPIYLAHKLSRKLSEVRKEGEIPYLRPDGKTQVSVEYVDGKPTKVLTVVVSTQHDDDVSHAEIESDIIEKVIRSSIPKELISDETEFFVNPTGRFVIGGPQGDCGLTGRKIIVDTYGGYASHGGGAFSGKDPTKVDRSGAYMARYIAKNIVASKLASKCEIELAYAIGVAKPVSILVNTHETGKVSDEKLVEIIKENFNLTPTGIIRTLDLQRPIYKDTAAYGHFGRNDVDFPWENTDKAEVLAKYL